MEIIVIGLGQSLRGDDAAGLDAVRLWQEQYPLTAQKVQVRLSELPGLALLDLFDSMDVAILVDAVQGAGIPGSLHRLGPDELASFTAGAQSAHGLGVAETLALGRSLYPQLAHCRLTLIGIVGEQFTMGTGLSRAVQAALRGAAVRIEKEIQDLL